MSFALWKSIVNQFATLPLAIYDEFWACSIGLFGEPLMDRGFFDKAAYYNKVFPKQSSTPSELSRSRMPLLFNTNANLLFPHSADRIIESFDEVYIHAAAIDSKTYHLLMPKLDYTTMLSNTQYLIKRNHILNGHLRIIVATPRTRHNLAELDVYKTFWLNEGADAVDFSQLLNRAGTLEMFDDLAVQYGNVECPNCQAATANNLIIDWDGVVLLCCQDFHRQLPIGHIAQEPIMQVLFSEKRHAVMQMLENKQHEQLVTCAMCKINLASE
ncbi:SPASM domain-containing protein [Rhodopseudomonas palustris]|nr:SPASM domain-containing protein [Rhodopseudomonas palustris]